MYFLFPVLSYVLFSPHLALCQDSGSEGTLLRGDKAEISVTVRDSSGEAISVPATVKIFKEGMPTDQKEASHGRAFFILRSLGDYTVAVNATGYKPAQKEVSVPVAVKAEVDVYLQKESAFGGNTGIPGRPLLAPKAKEALDKGLQALGDNKPKEAEKFVEEAAKLAPGHPDVLYVQGVLYLSLHNWAQAQGVLEKASQLEPIMRAFWEHWEWLSRTRGNTTKPFRRSRSRCRCKQAGGKRIGRSANRITIASNMTRR